MECGKQKIYMECGRHVGRIMFLQRQIPFLFSTDSWLAYNINVDAHLVDRVLCAEWVRRLVQHSYSSMFFILYETDFVLSMLHTAHIPTYRWSASLNP